MIKAGQVYPPTSSSFNTQSNQVKKLQSHNNYLINNKNNNNDPMNMIMRNPFDS